MSFKKSFFKNVSTFASYSYISQGFEFLSTIILSRLLLPEEYGFVAIILVFAGFMQLFASVGINASVVRSDYGNTFHRHLHSLAIWIGVALALIMMLMAYPIAIFFDNNELIFPTILVSFKFIFDALSHVPAAILSKHLNFKSVGTSHLLSSVSQISVTIILAYLGFSYWSLIIPLTVAPIIAYIYIIRIMRLPLKLYGWKAAKRVFVKVQSLMGYLTLSNLFTYWAGNADKVVIARFYTEFDLGLYNRAFRFIMIATKLITSIFSRVLLPSLKKLVLEKGNANKEYLDIIRIITLINMPILMLLLLFPRNLVLILWGEDWIGVAEYLPYVAIILFYQSMFRTTQPVFLLYNKEKILTFIHISNSIIKAVLVIIGSFYSIIHIITFLTLYEIFINLPVQVYFGFYKSFGFSRNDLFKYWIPVFLTGFGFAVSIYMNSLALRAIVFVLYNIQLTYDLRMTIHETLKVGLKTIRRK
jgi:O-antigen/teichoic acid export membrane protein